MKDHKLQPHEIAFVREVLAELPARRKMIDDHLSEFPFRAKDLETFKTTVKTDMAKLTTLITEGLSHPEPAEKTITRLLSMENEMRDLKKFQEDWNNRVNRVLFGDSDIIGMQTMVREIHDGVTKDRGFWDKFFFLAKISGAATAIGFLITGILVFIKKY